MISVKFKRETTNLTITAVYVKEHRLQFHDDVAFLLLEDEERCDIHWRIVSASTGGNLKITKTVGGVDKKIVDSDIPAGKDRLSDFTDFKV